MAANHRRGARILVTGANGFLGRRLVRRLLADGLGGVPVGRLVLSDLAFDAPARDPRLQRYEGSISDAGQLERMLAQPVDGVFHLAGVPADIAEREPEAGRRVNLDATLRLLKLLGRQAAAPRLVFASSVAVLGNTQREPIDEGTLPQPASSEGAQKLAAEVLIADAARRGAVNACSLRLPPVVARPIAATASSMAVCDALFRQRARGEPIVLAAAPETRAWWLSAGAAVDQLLHAATIDTGALGSGRVVQGPAQHLALQAVAKALEDALVAARGGAEHRALVRFKPPVGGQQGPSGLIDRPPLRTPRAEALGFRHDGDAQVLVRRVMQGMEEGDEVGASPGAGGGRGRQLAPAPAAWPGSLGEKPLVWGV